VSLIERQRVDEIIGAMAPAYAQATGRELEFYMSSPAQGAHVLNRPEDLS
jgi:galactokinase